MARPKIVSATTLLAVPERNHRRQLLPPRTDAAHSVRLDFVESPGVRTEEKHVADAALVDELLIEFADADAVAGIGGVLAGIGNGAAVDESHLLATGQCQQSVVNAVPTDARLQRLNVRAATVRERSSVSASLTVAALTSDSAHLSSPKSLQMLAVTDRGMDTLCRMPARTVPARSTCPSLPSPRVAVPARRDS